jgi:hypothetical protein
MQTAHMQVISAEHCAAVPETLFAILGKSKKSAHYTLLCIKKTLLHWTPPPPQCGKKNLLHWAPPPHPPPICTARGGRAIGLGGP